MNEEIEFYLSGENDRIGNIWQQLILQRFHDIAPNLTVEYNGSNLLINFGCECPKRYIIVNWINKMIAKNKTYKISNSGTF